MAKTWGQEMKRHDRNRDRAERNARIREREQAAARRREVLAHPVRAGWRYFWLGR